MMIQNKKGDIVIHFDNTLPINRLLYALVLERIQPRDNTRYDSWYGSSYVSPKFSVGKNGEYKLYSSVERGHIVKCNDSNCKDCSRHGIYNRHYPGHGGIDDSEAYSKYHQKTSNEYYAINRELQIGF